MNPASDATPEQRVQAAIAGFRAGLAQLRIPESEVKVTWVTEPGTDAHKDLWACFRCRARDGGVVERRILAAELTGTGPRDYAGVLEGLLAWFRLCVRKVCKGSRKLPKAANAASISGLHRVAFDGHFLKAVSDER